MPNDEAERAALAKLVPLVEGRLAIDGEPTAYVCVERTCKLPVTTPSELIAQLDEDPETDD